MNHLVVVNPRAGKRRGPPAADRVSRAFRKLGLSFEIATTNHPGHARILTAELGRGFDSIIAVGGDGTLQEVIQGLDLERHRLGVIPVGTGNDFAWMNDWPDSVEACAQRIAAGWENRIDLGVWEGSVAGSPRGGRFHNSIGLGFEALVNRESTRMKGRFGPFTYVLAVLRSLPRYRCFHVETTWDGGSFDGGTALLDVCIGKRVGGCFLIAPRADATDGKLDLILAEGMSLPRALLLLPRLFSGSHVRSSAVHQHQLGRVRMTFPDGIPMYVDGEFVDTALETVTAQILPGELRTF